MEEDIYQETEETIITNFLQFAVDVVPGIEYEEEKTVNCNHICICTFITDTAEPLALCTDTGAPRSVVGKK